MKSIPDATPIALTAGKRAGRAFCAGARHWKRRADLFELACGLIMVGAHPDADAQVLVDRERGENLAPLRDHRNAQPRDVLRRAPVGSHAFRLRRAFARLDRCGDNLEERRLARSVRANQAPRTPARNLERDVRQGREAIEGNGNIGCGEGGGHGLPNASQMFCG